VRRLGGRRGRPGARWATGASRADAGAPSPPLATGRLPPRNHDALLAGPPAPRRRLLAPPAPRPIRVGPAPAPGADVAPHRRQYCARRWARANTDWTRGGRGDLSALRPVGARKKCISVLWASTTARIRRCRCPGARARGSSRNSASRAAAASSKSASKRRKVDKVRVAISMLHRSLFCAERQKRCAAHTKSQPFPHTQEYRALCAQSAMCLMHSCCPLRAVATLRRSI